MAAIQGIAVDKGGQTLLKTANVGRDAGIVNSNDTGAFIAAAKTRQLGREKSVRTLAYADPLIHTPWEVNYGNK